MTRSWLPFLIDNTVMLAPRPLNAPGFLGIGDRLRAAAFAEMQAEAAFLWAAESLDDAPAELRSQWVYLAAEERKHMSWLLKRMAELGLAVDERPVSDHLWRSLVVQVTARKFCHYMADAEERGRRAGERFHERLLQLDPATAKIFGQIAAEERSHIELAYRFYPVGDLLASPR